MMSRRVWSRERRHALCLVPAATALLLAAAAAHAMVREEDAARGAAVTARVLITVKVAWVKEPVLKVATGDADHGGLNSYYSSRARGATELRVVEHLGTLLALKGGLTLDGDENVHDAVAGLTTVLGPDDPTVRRIFGAEGMAETHLVQRTIGLQPAGWPEEKLEFGWSEDQPRHYYLQPVDDDMYRRVELPDKEGYAITVRPTGPPESPMIELELARNVLSRGTYDGTIRAFVGRPTVVKTIVIPTVSLAAGQRALLVWEPRAQGGEQRVMARLSRSTVAREAAPGMVVTGGGWSSLGDAGKTSGQPLGVAVLLEVGPTPAPGEGVEE